MYTPGIISDEPQEAVAQLREELQRISLAFVEREPLVELHVAPARPRTGLVVLADGTNWNPGSGQGFYGYYNGGWHSLG